MSNAGTDPGGRIGVAVVGLGGAVATTAAAGVELMKLGSVGAQGLPLAGVDGLIPYTGLVFGGWDPEGDDLAKAAEGHQVLDHRQLQAVGEALGSVEPWPAVADAEFCRNVHGTNVVALDRLTDRVDRLRADLRAFREAEGLEQVVVVNLASTERIPDLDAPALGDPDRFEHALAEDDPAVTPGMVYAYAAITSGCPYVNFTPSASSQVPALLRLAERHGVPVAGKDGKTGQTLLKTVLAPAFRSRALTVDGWYSTNLLGNRDGEVLDDADSLASKVDTKGSVLDSMLGYPVADHLVRIDYYRPRGDEKEAWDAIDLSGFLGQRMQIKVDFLARDSVLAAPLVLELVRLVVEASRRGESGAQEQLGWFFKAPVTRDGSEPQHALYEQEQVLHDWLARR